MLVEQGQDISENSQSLNKLQFDQGFFGGNHDSESNNQPIRGGLLEQPIQSESANQRRWGDTWRLPRASCLGIFPFQQNVWAILHFSVMIFMLISKKVTCWKPGSRPSSCGLATLQKSMFKTPDWPFASIGLVATWPHFQMHGNGISSPDFQEHRAPGAELHGSGVEDPSETSVGKSAAS